jgi:tRNA modification GTPase
MGVDGVPLIVTDTAGLRVSTDHIEAIGVDRTRREAADSDLLIVVIDGSESLTEEDHQVLSEAVNRRYIIALNKSDLGGFSATRITDDPSSIVSVSAKTATGLDRLRAAILEPFTNGNANGEGLLITNARHHDLLTRTIDAIRSSENLLLDRASEEIILVGLLNALRYLGEITGETTSDEILGKIFSTFCIGK